MGQQRERDEGQEKGLGDTQAEEGPGEKPNILSSGTESKVCSVVKERGP